MSSFDKLVARVLSAARLVKASKLKIENGKLVTTQVLMVLRLWVLGIEIIVCFYVVSSYVSQYVKIELENTR